jgi:hypothetical protein
MQPIPVSYKVGTGSLLDKAAMTWIWLYIFNLASKLRVYGAMSQFPLGFHEADAN